MKPEVITELNVADLLCLSIVIFSMYSQRKLMQFLNPDTSSNLLEIGLLHLQLFHFLIKMESATFHVLLQLPKQMICHEVRSVSVTMCLHTARVKHKTHCSHFTGT